MERSQMQGLAEINHRLEALTSALSSSQRRELARVIGRDLRASLSDDILANREPDGRAMRARIKGRSRKSGRMFQKLGARRSMTIRANSRGVQITFAPKNRQIAEIHHFGLRSRVYRHIGPYVTYSKRELMGISDNGRSIVENLVINHLQF